MQIRLMFVALGAACMLFLGLSVLQWRWAAGKRSEAAELLEEAEKRREQAGRVRREGCRRSVCALLLGAAFIAVLVITAYLVSGAPPSWLP